MKRVDKAQNRLNVKASRKLQTTTRGKVLTMLREETRTVAQMAKALHITENGIRAQLAALEEEGLVRQAGVLPGTRKPFNAYELTDEGEKLFPTPYGPMLDELLDVLGEQCTEHQVNKICDETARRFALKFSVGNEKTSFESRVTLALRVISEMGGVASVTDGGAKLIVHGKTCPVSELVKGRPRTCHFVQQLISTLTGCEVVEKCERGGKPHCCFEIVKPSK